MMKKEHQQKKEHHYVWANYLRNWSTTKNNVWFRSTKGKIVEDSVRLIAKERHFYHVKYLTEKHIELIKVISSKSKIQDEHLSLLNDFILIQIMKESYETQCFKEKEIEALFLAHEHNSLENLHTAYESGARICLEHLANKNISIFNDNKLSLNFLHYLGHQLSRTKAFKDLALLSMKKSKTDDAKLIARLSDECWWFLSHIYGDNIGLSLYQTRNTVNHCLLINETEIPFITSDCPIVNIHPELNKNIITPPKEHQFDLYYPISPSIAYVFCSSGQFKKGLTLIDIDIAQNMNIKISKMAHNHIFGDSENSIRPFVRYVGEHHQKVQQYVYT